MDTLLFSLDSRVELANAIIKHANECVNMEDQNKVELGELRVQKFSDGELCVDFTDSVRGKRVYLLTSPNTSDEIMKLMLAINAAKLSGAKEIIPILPFYPYARSDKREERGPIGAKIIATTLESLGATALITFDLHADQIVGYWSIPVLHIQGKNVFDEYIVSISNKNTMLISPDAGSGKRIKRMINQLTKYGIKLTYAMMDKTRKEANIVSDMEIIGDVMGKDVIILDDMVDTFGTADKAVNVLLENGANNVRMIVSHGICSGPALERISKSKLTELVISDSLAKPIDYNGLYPNDKIVVISVARQIGLTVSALNNNLSYDCLNNNCNDKR